MFAAAKKAFVSLFFDRDDNESWTGIITVLVIIGLAYWLIMKAYNTFFVTDYKGLRIETLQQELADEVASRDELLDLEKAETARKEELRKTFHDAFYSEKEKREKTEKELALLKELMQSEKYQLWLQCGYPSELDAHRLQ